MLNRLHYFTTQNFVWKKCLIWGVLALVAWGCSSKADKPDFSWFENGVKQYAATVPVYTSAAVEVSSLAPEVLFGYANYLYTQGEKEKSVFVYYLAQLRARILLDSRKASTGLEIPYYEAAQKQAGVAVFGKNIYLDAPTRYGLYTRDIMPALGSVINGWVGADPDVWARQMQNALDYDETHPFYLDKIHPAEILKSKPELQQISAEQRKGFRELIQYATVNKEQILEQRAKQKAAMEEFEKKMAALKAQWKREDGTGKRN